MQIKDIQAIDPFKLTLNKEETREAYVTHLIRSTNDEMIYLLASYENEEIFVYASILNQTEKIFEQVKEEAAAVVEQYIEAHQHEIEMPTLEELQAYEKERTT